MNLTIIITNNNQLNLKTVFDLLNEKYSNTTIFFLFDAAYHANETAWLDFIQEFKLNVTICAASAGRRGIKAETLAAGFKIGSIGEMVESCDAADRVISL